MNAIYDAYKNLGTAIVSDVLDEAGFHNQTLDPSLAFIGSVKAVCGPAVCVFGERIVSTKTEPADGSTLPLYNLPSLSSEGSVLVLATSGFKGGAVTGELLANDLQEAGVVAFITDGLVRDSGPIDQMDISVIAAGVIPTNGARRFQITQWSASIQMPGPEGAMVKISPGDLVLGDCDGVIVIPAAQINEILRLSQELAVKESQLKEQSKVQSADIRAAARASRMSHMVWLRT